MMNDNDDSSDNPWDEGDAPKPRKKSTPKEEETILNPWSKADNTRKISGSSFNTNSPEDLFASVVKQFKKTTNNRFSNGKSGGGNGGSNNKIPQNMKSSTLFVILLVFVGLWLSSGFFRVQEGEVAVVMRFGKMTRIAGPGLQYRFPSPIENEIIRKVGVLNKIDSALKVDSVYGNNDTFDRTLVLTGDENMVHINYTVLWRISDVADFLFSVRDPETTILAAAETAIREVMGQTSARAALTQERDAIGTKAQELLQKILDHYKMGAQIVSIQLQKVEAPAQVIDAFNDMQASLTDGDRMRNEAEGYRSEKIPQARGEAIKIIQEAEAYAQEATARAQGEADRFNAVYAEYKMNPEIARRRVYLDTMRDVLSRVQKTIIDPKIASGLVPYFHLQPGVKPEKSQG